MPSKKINILNVIPSYGINGGMEHYVYGLLSGIKKSNLNLDVVAFNWGTTNNELENKFKEKGIRTFTIANPNNNLFKFIKEIKLLLNNNHYDVIHVHPLGVAIFFLWQAKKANIKHRIFHVHEARASELISHRIRNKFFLIFDKLFATEFIAVSKNAGERLLKNTKFEVLPACIDKGEFSFNELQRKKWRSKLKLHNKDFVIGSVGRFCKVKNFEFGLKVLHKLVQENENIYYILCGDGKYKSKYKKIIKKYDLNNHVFIINQTDKVNSLYSAFDCLIMPSKHEGVGLVAVEAQFNGLQVLASNKVPSEANVGSCKFFKLKSSVWAREAAFVWKKRKRFPIPSTDYFDDKINSKKLHDFYMQLKD